MKKITISIVFLILIASTSLLAQGNAEQKKVIKPALLVIDIQNEYLPMVPERDKEIGMYYINSLIQLFRLYNYPVVRVYHTDKQHGPQPGTEKFEFPTSVLVKADDPKVIKNYGDGFNKTELDQILKEKGCNTLFLCGLSAVGCVLSTWIGAQNHDYTAFMVKDAIMSHNSVFTDNVEVMFDAVGFDVVKLIVESSK